MIIFTIIFIGTISFCIMMNRSKDYALLSETYTNSQHERIALIHELNQCKILNKDLKDHIKQLKSAIVKESV